LRRQTGFDKLNFKRNANAFKYRVLTTHTHTIANTFKQNKLLDNPVIDVI